MQNKDSSTQTTKLGLYLGIDFGTSGCRAIAIDQNKKIVASCFVNYKSEIYQAQHHEQEPQLWWHSFIKLMSLLAQQIELQTIKSLVLDATSGTILLVDSNGTALSNALMYNDSRATAEAQEIKKFATKSFAVLNSSSGLAKILWLNNNIKPRSSNRFCHQADWLIGQLTGNYAQSDYNNALKSGYDINTRCWPEWLTALGINLSQLPTVSQPGIEVALIKQSLATQIGFSNQLIIKTGCTDSTAAVIATGADKIGDAITSLGSSLVVKIISKKIIFNSKYGIYSQPYRGNYLVGGASNSGGAVLKHFFSASQMHKMSKKINLNTTSGLDYYPLLQDGERFPINDARYPARLAPRPKDDVEFFKALLEGITAIEKLAYDQLTSLATTDVRQIFSMGGGAKNTVWTKMRQTKLQIPIVTPQNTEAAYGVALLALGDN